MANTRDAGRRFAGERAEVEAEYRRVLKTAVEFEKKIRNRWRQRVREKNEKIAELEARVAGLEKELRAARRQEESMDRETRERKLVTLMMDDMGIAEAGEAEMAKLDREVRGLSDEELDGTLAERLGLGYPVDRQELEDALRGVREQERLSEGPVGAPDMSHNPGPGENRD